MQIIDCVMEFRQFLELKFLEWQQESGGRKTVLEFAKYLGVGRTSISMWWNGDRTPEGANVEKLAKRLGLEVYDVLGLPRPNPELHYLQQVWDDLPPELRRSLREQAEAYTTKNDAKQLSKKARPRTAQ